MTQRKRQDTTQPVIDREAITTHPDLERIGNAAWEALEHLDNGEYDSARDMIIEVTREIYPNAWQPVECQQRRSL